MNLIPVCWRTASTNSSAKSEWIPWNLSLYKKTWNNERKSCQIKSVAWQGVKHKDWQHYYQKLLFKVIPETLVFKNAVDGSMEILDDFSCIAKIFFNGPLDLEWNGNILLSYKLKCSIVASHHVACDIYVHDIFENFERNVDLLLVSLQCVWPQEQKSLK